MSANAFVLQTLLWCVVTHSTSVVGSISCRVSGAPRLVCICVCVLLPVLSSLSGVGFLCLCMHTYRPIAMFHSYVSMYFVCNGFESLHRAMCHFVFSSSTYTFT